MMWIFNLRVIKKFPDFKQIIEVNKLEEVLITLPVLYHYKLPNRKGMVDK